MDARSQAGEFWYKLFLSAEPAPAVVLPDMKAEAGASSVLLLLSCSVAVAVCYGGADRLYVCAQSQVVRIENPADEEIVLKGGFCLCLPIPS